ncbi:MAG TPA: hypothetical protein DD377_00685 [Firmicutes bacterium]|nr:hypothetical protein [Bacillota bacterium]
MINQVTLVGRLTKDAEIKKVGENLILLGSLAQNVGKKGEEKAYYFDFFKIVENDKIVSYLKKGALLAVTGSLTYKEKEIEKKHIRYYSIRVTSIDFLEPKETAKKEAQEIKEEDLPF